LPRRLEEGRGDKAGAGLSPTPAFVHRNLVCIAIAPDVAHLTTKFLRTRYLIGCRGAALIARTAVPELRELEAKLAVLRRDVAAARHGGCTPSEILKLRRDCATLWAAIERLKYAGGTRSSTPDSPTPLWLLPSR
jgi:hypothetical protein